jgi:hypothetical protein
MEDFLAVVNIPQDGRRCQNRSRVCAYLEPFAFLFLVSYKGRTTVLQLTSVQNHACYRHGQFWSNLMLLLVFVVFTCVQTEHLDFRMALKADQI